MDILVMGNGFDLAHKIPSSYKNFLEFITAFNNFYKYKNPAPPYMPPDKTRFRDKLHAISPMYKDVVSLIYSSDASEAEILQEFFTITENNQWIDYFQTCLNRRAGYGDTYNWVDIEEEVADVIKTFTDYEKKFGYLPFYRTEIEHKIATGSEKVVFSKNLIYSAFERIKNSDEGKIKDEKVNKSYRDLQKDWILFSQKLEGDFDRVIRALEIYLSFFVDFDKVKPSPYFENVKFDRLVTFNYTDTYQMIYKKDKFDLEIKGDFVHGKADYRREAAQNNMVVGIEEFLPDDEKNKNIEFVSYRKYYQRIVKRCDYSYSKLLQKEKDISTWFVGHSMAATDKDILSKLLPTPERNKNNISKAYICYYSEDAFRQEVVNLVQILGQDCLSELTCGADSRIVFLKQDDIKKYMQEKLEYDTTSALFESCSHGRR